MNARDPRILIVAGEASGDLHAASLVRAIRAQAPRAELFGVGGDRMRSAGVELLYHIDQMAVLGFTEVVRHIPFFRRVMRHLLSQIGERRPHLVILVDYPGFNLRLARRARRYPVKIMYYIAPQVWAWSPGRAQRMAAWVDRLAVVFDFEEELFHVAGVDAHFVGHPLLEGLETKQTREAFLAGVGVDSSSRVLGLLPGSRVQEISRILPEMVRTWNLLRQGAPGLQAVVARAPGVPKQVYESGANRAAVVASDRTYEVMSHCDALIVASGTATLEAACFATPFVVVYKVSPLSYQIGKRLVRIPDIGLVNVVAGRRVVPEFIQQDFRADAVGPVLARLLSDESEREKMVRTLKTVRARLGERGASTRAARLALELLASARSPRAHLSHTQT